MESKGDGKSISVAQSLAAANKQGVFYAYLRTVDLLSLIIRTVLTPMLF
jgi:hypothetical protein